LVRLDPALCIFGALLLLTLPLNWLAAAVTAAAIHEACHILILHCQGNRIRHLTIGIGGAKLQTDFASRKQELLCALAGPVGSLCLLSLHGLFPRLALCGAVQGLYNLLPIYPLDGGRILACVLAIWLPGREEIIIPWVRRIAFCVLLALSVAGSIGFSLGIWPVLVWILLICKAFRRKIPCKPRRIGVQ